jgi:hypothetical protein
LKITDHLLKRLNGRNVLSSIRDLLSSKRLARTKPASATHATHGKRRFQHADAEGSEVEWNHSLATVGLF